MFLVLLFLTLLHAVDCPRWKPVTVAMTHGGGQRYPEPRPPAGRTRCQRRWQWRRYQPRRPPLGEAPGTGPPSRPEGVYTPTAHEGAPARGDGPGSSLGEGCGPGSGAGPHAAAGGWRYSRGHSRHGTAAPPPTGCGRRGGRRTLPPPPPPGESRGLGGRQSVPAAHLEM